MLILDGQEQAVSAYANAMREEGRNEGRDEGAVDTARLMLKRGYPVQEISLLVCLPVEKIKKLASTLHLAQV